ncbi:prepilin-type N-terminal cleavage/methylation domain-containing protein [Acinetobacter indicus]|uniref:prepilin-type N-terminal cleavage/methylation domain-containing protein n=1 Tax=Acinetobacter indicus TaxID=756892 RepID=UPI0013623E60|nr:prepilin-type N-terminal cleavage/methylation domain-containing protein [Acinetobacter indicus]MDM1310843.1 prepilin-type N-terminal cleavage/methylation domain-containing protein [Acinetobacter indicus]
MKIFHNQIQKGFTLLELMIALALGLIITAAAIQLILGSFITTKLQDANAQIQDSGLFGLEYIVKDIQLINYGNDNKFEIRANTENGGLVLNTANIVATTVNGLPVADLVSQSNGLSNMEEIESDQLTIQFVAPIQMLNCEGVNVRAGDLIVQRYFIRDDTTHLSLVCDANIPTPAQIDEIIVNSDGSEESRKIDNPPQKKPTILNGLGVNAQVVIPRIDQFKVLIGGMDNNGAIAYYDIPTFKTKPNLKAVAIKLSVLVRAENIVSSQNINPAQEFNLFGIESLSGFSGSLSDQTAANRIPRQVYIATVALRNGLGENDD